ncbi:MAG TPA: N-acyl homoserine lactonase family protein [Burkholderiales bacterium]|nr:N-acyl homoserine lactonase family protein [Burkholderiales bacterium]
MKRSSRLILGGAAFCLTTAFGAYAQDPTTAYSPPPPAGMKLYAFSSGALTIGKGVLQNFGPMDPPIKIPVGFYVIHHPKGNVLFDTGNNDKIITDPSYWGPMFKAISPVNTPDMAIDVQLKKIGMSPDDIKYVVVSHMHLDHGGNVAKFPHSTLIIQKDEINMAFFPPEPYAGPYIPGDAMALRSPTGSNQPNAMNMVVLDKQDMDVFGDGSVIVKNWQGHTAGSQMMLVRLRKTGPIILTGDNVYFRENVEKHLPPNLVLAYNPAGIMRAYDWIRFMMATEHADFFTAHDPDAFMAMKKAPDYYE